MERQKQHDRAGSLFDDADQHGAIICAHEGKLSPGAGDASEKDRSRPSAEGQDSAFVLRMQQFLPQIDAALPKLGVQPGQAGEGRDVLPDPVANIAYLPLDVALDPAGRDRRL